MNTLKQLIILTKRIVKQNLTSVDTIITSIIMPIFILLFFVYVMGGNIVIDGTSGDRTEYLSYAMPGFLIMSMAMGSAYTALRINNDKTKGFMTRLLSMPMKRWVILGSHILASTLFMILSVISVFATGIIFGYRPQASLGEFLLFLGLIILFAVAITVLAIPFSLSAKDYASAGAFSYLLLFLLFISPAFIPVASMAKPIRLFAENQPMTPIIETAKALLNGTFTFHSTDSLLTLVWLASLLIIFSFLSLKRYKQIFVNV
ncbi:ABC-2 type transport system permease [Enterococcus sp. AZ194]|uniref:ABC transporter permease n=1 Tax=Enterococcus sp. AZ194 TaxID=2774629 RepID=UPI003F21E3C7